MKKTIKLIALMLVLVLSVVTLASCLPPNPDPEKAIEALEENGYKAAHDDKIIPIAFKLRGIKDLDDVVIASAKIDGELEYVTILYFDDADAAKAAWEEVQDYAEETEDEDDSDWTIGKFSNMIWYGTEAAIKATY